MKNDKKVIGIIPARMSSTRFPGKPLKEILGFPMIGHVYHRSKMSDFLDEVYIATPDQEIKEYVESIGAKAVIGRNDHVGCPGITAEVLIKIEEELGENVDVVVMIQGDEPLIKPEMINMAVQPMLEDASIKVLNLMAPVKSVEEHEDPNCPKVVVDKDNFALYFSREPIPSKKKWGGGEVPAYKQVCIIPFTRDFLLEFDSMPPTTLERIESIDMIRVLENGEKVKMVYQENETHAVDVPEDIEKVENLMKGDDLSSQYLK